MSSRGVAVACHPLSNHVVVGTEVRRVCGPDAWNACTRQNPPRVLTSEGEVEAGELRLSSPRVAECRTSPSLCSVRGLRHLHTRRSRTLLGAGGKELRMRSSPRAAPALKLKEKDRHPRLHRCNSPLLVSLVVVVAFLRKRRQEARDLLKL